MIIIAFIIAIVLVLLFAKLDNSQIIESKLYISEIMSKNTYTIKDKNNNYFDYIEIYNGFNNKINLEGYHLSDSEYKTSKWTFPNIEMDEGEYLIIYASGKDNCEDKLDCHTNFKLSSKGEVLTLTDRNNNIINKFTYPSLCNDIAYGYVKKKYTLLDKPTPGLQNSDKYIISDIIKDDLFINEYMSNNKRNNYDSSGNYYDFVELYNNSNSDLNLHNIYLSDDNNDLMKYKLPDVIIKKNDYLLILLSDESKVIDNQIYANFKLSTNDKKILISNGVSIIDEVDLVPLIDNVSYGRYGSKWYYFTKPTPGLENNTFGHVQLGNTS